MKAEAHFFLSKRGPQAALPQPGLLQHIGWLLGSQVSAADLGSGTMWHSRLGLYSEKENIFKIKRKENIIQH